MLVSEHTEVKRVGTLGVRESQTVPSRKVRLQHILDILVEGTLREYDKDYITGQILERLKGMADPASLSSNDFQSVKQEIVEPFYELDSAGDESVDGAEEASSPKYATRFERTLSDPAVMEKHKDEVANGTYFYGDVAGSKLFINGVSARDVDQNDIGDCYFVAALASMADANPQLIKNAIKDNHNGTYTVRFYGKSGRPVYITVDDDFLQKKDGSLVYGASTNKKELWVAVMEKAYAQWKGGYEKIGNGGHPKDAIQALTGKQSTLVYNSKASTSSLYTQINNALRKDKPIVADTLSDANKYKNTGLYKSHAYTVIGVKEENGEKYVILRNPWGHGEWSGKGADSIDDGVFKMTIEDFKKMFEKVTISN